MSYRDTAVLFQWRRHWVHVLDGENNPSVPRTQKPGPAGARSNVKCLIAGHGSRCLLRSELESHATICRVKS